MGRGGPGPGPGPGGGRVPCPLCRKLSPLPRGGAAALPVNTTLAEVVKLYRSAAAGEPEQGQGQGSGPGPLALRGTCQKHPGRLVQLYCRMCRRAGCGQCVSEEHQGIFHSVNLLDTVFQEEKVSARLRAGLRQLPRFGAWDSCVRAERLCRKKHARDKSFWLAWVRFFRLL